MSDNNYCKCGHIDRDHQVGSSAWKGCLVAGCKCQQYDYTHWGLAKSGGLAAIESVQTMTSIKEHEGRKYLKKIWPAVKDEDGDEIADNPILVDVYCVIEAFKVTCPGRQQAIKKLLMAGDRGKGDVVADLIGAQAAINRAIELARQREREVTRD